jgi:hypothetical protein
LAVLALEKIEACSTRLSRIESPTRIVAKIAAVEFIFCLGHPKGSGTFETTVPSGDSGFGSRFSIYRL